MANPSSFNFKPLVPYLIILICFWIASLAYFFPLLEGKKLTQNDVVQSVSSARQNTEYRKETGKLPLWSESMFGGMPSFLIAMDYPNSWTSQLARVFVRLAPEPANIVFLHFLGFCLMAWMLGYNRWTAILGGIAYAFASYSIINIEAGHISKSLALAFAPPFVGAVVMTFRGKYLLGSVLAGLFAGIQLYANHIQITYYVILILVMYGIYEFITIFFEKENRALAFQRFFKATAFLVVAGLLAVGTHTSRLWTNYEFAKQTIRGKAELTSNKESKGGTDRDYAFQWSYGIGESFTFLIPHFYGGGTGIGASLGEKSNSYKTLQNNNLDPQFVRGLPFYWGSQPFTSGPAYLGAVVCFLFLFGLLLSRDKLKWWLLTVTVFLVFLAWGKNFEAFNYFIFDTLPLYNKFRAHTMTLSLLQMFVAWMVILGLEEFFKKDFDKKRAMQSLKISAGTIGGLALVFALIGGAFQDYKATGKEQVMSKDGKVKTISKDDAFVENITQSLQGNQQVAEAIMDAIEDDRAAMQSGDAWRSLIFILLAAAVIWVFLNMNLKIEYALSILIGLTLIDLWAIDRRYLNNENFVKKSQVEDLYEASDADRQIMADKALNFRVLNTSKDVFNDATTSYYHNSVGGYHATKMRRYQDLIENHLTKNNMSVFNMLNTKYFIGSNPQTGELITQQNPNALGNAWFVDSFKIVKNADEEIKALEKFEPKKVAFIDQRFAEQVKSLKIKPDTTAKIQLTKAEPDYLVYESNTKNPQLAIFSEIYYVEKGKIEWQVFIDGKAVPHLRANYVLRGLVIPAGKHKIEFKFQVPIYHTGELISLICSILLFAGAGFAIFMLWKGKNL